ncbi:MAG: hypothetical protein M1824_003467 [Vezdaea acicularis]|nr:MAG: hypothetical protein M1824_003467 [Vezdaea acicularis]
MLATIALTLLISRFIPPAHAIWEVTCRPAPSPFERALQYLLPEHTLPWDNEVSPEQLCIGYATSSLPDVSRRVTATLLAAHPNAGCDCHPAGSWRAGAGSALRCLWRHEPLISSGVPWDFTMSEVVTEFCMRVCVCTRYDEEDSHQEGEWEIDAETAAQILRDMARGGSGSLTTGTTITDEVPKARGMGRTRSGQLFRPQNRDTSQDRGSFVVGKDGFKPKAFALEGLNGRRERLTRFPDPVGFAASGLRASSWSNK